MTVAHEIRRHLLKARNEIEQAQDRVQESAQCPAELREGVDEAHRRVTFAEARAAQWAEA